MAKEKVFLVKEKGFVDFKLKSPRICFTVLDRWFCREKPNSHEESYLPPCLFSLPSANLTVDLQPSEKIKMYNFFKAVFGVPPNEQERYRMDSSQPNDFRNHYRGGGNDDDDDDDDDDNDDDHHLNLRPPFDGNMASFGFPIFSDPIEIHKYFESLVNEMHKKFETFGFQNNQMWEDNQNNFSSFFNEEPNNRKPEALRDTFLKNPGYISNAKKEDVDLDGQVKVGDVENFLRKNSESSIEVNNPQVQNFPKVFSKSVFIRTIRRPDGTVETIRKVCDHTGKEETTITLDNNMNDPKPQDGQVILSNDVPGISIFKKFFPF